MRTDLASLGKANALLLYLKNPPKVELAIVYSPLQISRYVGVKQYCSKHWTACFKKKKCEWVGSGNGCWITQVTLESFRQLKYLVCTTNKNKVFGLYDECWPTLGCDRGILAPWMSHTVLAGLQWQETHHCTLAKVRSHSVSCQSVYWVELKNSVSAVRLHPRWVAFVL